MDVLNSVGPSPSHKVWPWSLEIPAENG
jgi:hypothetical protein